MHGSGSAGFRDAQCDVDYSVSCCPGAASKLGKLAKLIRVGRASGVASDAASGSADLISVAATDTAAKALAARIGG